MSWFSIVKEDDMCCANARAGLLKIIHDIYEEVLRDDSTYSEKNKDKARVMRDESIKNIQAIPCPEEGVHARILTLRILMEAMVSKNENFQNEIALEVRPAIQRLLRDWDNCKKRYE